MLRTSLIPALMVAIAFAGWGHAVLAADSEGRFAIKGAGQQSCAKYREAWEQDSTDLGLYGGWIEGYLTGLNQFRDATFDITPWQTTETLLGATRSICQQLDAETKFMDAFYVVLRAFGPQRLAEETSARRLQWNGRSVVAYKGVLQRVQQRLVEAGYEPGPIDGEFRPETAAALAAYQKKEGLESTGLPTGETLFSLFVPHRVTTERP